MYRVHLSNLPTDTKQIDIENLVCAYASVIRVNIIPDSYNRCRGFAFIDFSDEKEHAEAIITLNNRILNGNYLKAAISYQGIRNTNISPDQSEYN